MGAFYGGGFAWFILIVLTMYLYCTRNDNNHIQTYKKFAIFGIKTVEIAAVVTVIVAIMLLLRVFVARSPGDDDDHDDDYYEGAYLGMSALSSVFILVVGLRMYPDANDYWFYNENTGGTDVKPL